MKTKVEETTKMIKVNEVLKRGGDYDVTDEIKMNALEDIAMSLAIIADNMSKLNRLCRI